ncbi:hypothetical protein GQ607_003731 [Colletotrichum asianum]|uniref:Uncharacterized protein n=1 Tax=Colletotrichum asianum TaxID=702518 RepID=A0A8H3ZRG1_9PEZI|nr:hypothetical protein GQ607_003731 [Colletotrichum asianum]
MKFIPTSVETTMTRSTEAFGADSKTYSTTSSALRDRPYPTFRGDASTFPQLVVAWLLTFVIIITVRNSSQSGLEKWEREFPVCDPTDWRDLYKPSRSFLIATSCEFQIAQLAVLEISLLVNCILLLWKTKFGERHATWIITTSVAGTALTTLYIHDPATALFLAMPMVLSICLALGFLVDTFR